MSSSQYVPGEQGYLWKKSTQDCPPLTSSSSGPSFSRATFSRKLTNLERMLVILNRDLYGQNCTFMGAEISLRTQASSLDSPLFDLSQLQERAIDAFCQTRWRYPTVATRINGDRAVYNVESEAEVKSWARRAVSTISLAGGWLALRERVSRDSPLPTVDGDYCSIYIVLQPNETRKGESTTFDILLHMHHALTDGSGIRSVLNEFLTRLAQPLSPSDISWGGEAERLLPASVLLIKKEEPEVVATSSPSQDSVLARFKGFSKGDIGLPVYRPEIGPPEPKYRGSLLVSHTFDSDFLPRLLAVGRKHGVKLAAVLHAALLQTVHELSDTIPGLDDLYQSASALDLRNGWMISPYCERKAYANCAAVVLPIEVPCKLFKTRVENDAFWEAASFIGGLWETIKRKKGMGKTVEAEAAAFIHSRDDRSASNDCIPSKPRTCPYFVSDPPGSQILNSTFPVSGYSGLLLVLQSYQLATDQTHALISARSHSWNNKLTLCLVFNAVRNPKEKIREVLEKWIEVLEFIS